MLYNDDKLKMTGGFNMRQIKTLEEALSRIAELEKENSELREELEYLRKRKASGRQKHNAKWMAIYNDFVVCYEKGMTVVEIAERNGISERSMYRYKAYYEKLQKESQKS
jgi:transposase-like protein